MRIGQATGRKVFRSKKLTDKYSIIGRKELIMKNPSSIGCGVEIYHAPS